MRKKIVLIYLLILLILLFICGYYFIYNIYGSAIRRTPQNLFADTTSEMLIEVVPVNALGKKAWFRNSSATFELIEGVNLVEIIEYNKELGFLKIRSRGKAGLVGIKIKSEHSLLPEYIEIEIIGLTA
ncbi:MAG: hypothetical protein MUF28_00865 [Ignavibacterium sp.]|jgi:hypothetical protein|nr:hypothetical protein [Ignavibacterium sp.]